MYVNDEYRHGFELGRGFVDGLTAAIEADGERKERERLLADPGIEGIHARATRDLWLQYSKAMDRIDALLGWSFELEARVRFPLGAVHGI